MTSCMLAADAFERALHYVIFIRWGSAVIILILLMSGAY